MQPQSTSSPDATSEAAPEARRPRIGLMGEFSAGKSTLSNLLIGARALPTQITATQLPPVWLAHGDEPAYRVTVDGGTDGVDLDDISSIPLEETMYIRVFKESPMLEMCDLIDFPGISDPNMPSEVWERVAPMVDSMLWLTHANQAWRQSEAAVWDSLPPELRATSFLLLTRIDKIVSDRDRRRLEGRVRRETDGLFAEVFPVSLVRAAAAGADRAEWAASGAEAFTDALIAQIARLSDQLGYPRPTANPFHAAFPDAPEAPSGGAEIVPITRQVRPGGQAEAPQAGRIVPRRVAIKRAGRRPEAGA